MIMNSSVISAVTLFHLSIWVWRLYSSPIRAWVYKELEKIHSVHNQVANYWFILDTTLLSAVEVMELFLCVSDWLNWNLFVVATACCYYYCFTHQFSQSHAYICCILRSDGGGGDIHHQVVVAFNPHEVITFNFLIHKSILTFSKHRYHHRHRQGAKFHVSIGTHTIFRKQMLRLTFKGA